MTNQPGNTSSRLTRTSACPIAVFAYNRPSHLSSALESLSRNDRLSECNVVVYCDGPKTRQDVSPVAAARRVASEWASGHGGTVVERKENLGLAQSIVAGVSEQCEAAGRVIVVEDDLILAPRFVDYMLQALDRYEAEDRVYQVSGFMFPVDHPLEPDAFLLPLTTTWGWATWARAWKAFDWTAPGAASLETVTVPAEGLRSRRQLPVHKNAPRTAGGQE